MSPIPHPVIPPLAAVIGFVEVSPYDLSISYYGQVASGLPHIVKVSGGRSSAMMALRLAQQGALHPTRGDIALFANTSAEHPETYEFAARVSGCLEQMGLPVLWYEFCTVEDAPAHGRGGYRRRPSYRLVNRRPHSVDNPDGYRNDGSVFTEYLSWKQRLPNPRQRTCTSTLKLVPGQQLLDEWLDGPSTGPKHAGHWEERSLATPDSMWSEYRGKMGRAEFLRKTERLRSAPPSRPAQPWDDFTNADVDARPEAPSSGLFAPSNPTRYVTIIGLRADEPRRVDRIMSRTIFALGAGSTKCRISNQPPGEIPVFPLHESGIVKQDVINWWSGSPPVSDLKCVGEAGNCVFCFMKGPRALAELNRNKSLPVDSRGTPVDIDWWVDTERLYRRRIPARDPRRSGKQSATFGFLGIGYESYAQVRAGNTPVTAPRNDRRGLSVGAAACDCTD